MSIGYQFARQPSARFNETVAKIADTKPVMLIQQATQLSDVAFRIVATHAPFKAPLDEADYDQMLATATNNQFRLFPATLQPLNQSNGQHIVSFIIEANTQIKDYSETEVRERMRVLTANVFVDDSDNTIWRVVENGDQKYLVQSIKEDFAKLLGARLAKRSNQIVSNAHYAGIIPANGDYIQYYDKNLGNLAFGFAMTSNDNTVQVCERTSGNLVKIDPTHVVAAAQGSSLDKKYSLANYLVQQTGSNTVLAEEFSPAALGAFVDYMRQLYGGTDYFVQLEKLIRNRRGQPKLINTFSD